MQKRERIETVFVATDFSETASVAIEWAARLARPHDARIVLYHGVSAPPPPLLSPGPEVTDPTTFEIEREDAVRQLDETARRLRDRGLDVTCDVQIDLGAATILRRAAAQGCNLIIAGTRGRTLRRAILGSTAKYLVRHAQVPVVVVPKGARMPNSYVQRVLIPTDFGNTMQDTVDTLEGLLGPATAAAEVTLMHVHKASYQPASPWAAPLVLSPRTPAANEATHRLEMTANGLAHHLRTIDTVTCAGDPARAIAREAQLLAADLIVMARGPDGIARFLRTSTTERVLAEAPCPVLSIRREHVGAERADVERNNAQNACGARSGASA